jgi:hypothetical protein
VASGDSRLEAGARKSESPPMICRMPRKTFTNLLARGRLLPLRPMRQGENQGDPPDRRKGFPHAATNCKGIVTKSQGSSGIGPLRLADCVAKTGFNISRLQKKPEVEGVAATLRRHNLNVCNTAWRHKAAATPFFRSRLDNDSASEAT